MIMRSIVIVLFLGVLSKAQNPPQCGENQVYFTCGTGCPSTCENKNPQWCNVDCKAGCFCKAGYVKNAAGSCVHPSSCPSPKAATPCSIANEEYKDCGTACPKTCRNQDPGQCPTGCVSGCFCKDGYYRNDTGACVTKDKCPSMNIQQACRTDEVWNSCGTNCEGTCQDREPTCDKRCKPGCFCKDGTVRKDNTAKAACVAPSSCN